MRKISCIWQLRCHRPVLYCFKQPHVIENTGSLFYYYCRGPCLWGFEAYARQRQIMGVQCQIIMWPRLRGALQVPCLSVWSHRDDVTARMHVLWRCSKTQTYKNPCNQSDRWKHVVCYISLILCTSFCILYQIRDALIHIVYYYYLSQIL